MVTNLPASRWELGGRVNTSVVSSITLSESASHAFSLVAVDDVKVYCGGSLAFFQIILFCPDVCHLDGRTVSASQSSKPFHSRRLFFWYVPHFCWLTTFLVISRAVSPYYLRKKKGDWGLSWTNCNTTINHRLRNNIMLYKAELRLYEISSRFAAMYEGNHEVWTKEREKISKNGRE